MFLLLNSRKKILNDLSLVVHVVKSEGVEIIKLVRGSIDLDSTETGKAGLDSSSATSDNILHEKILTVKERIRKLVHPVVGVSKALAVGKDQLLDGTLLEVREALNFCGQRGTTIGNTLEVVGRSDGGSTAVVHKFDTTAFNLADGTVLRNTNMRAVDHEAISIIGNVSAHSAESSVSSKGKSGELIELYWTKKRR